MIDDVSSEDGEGSIRGNAVDGGKHAILEAHWRITGRIAIWTCGVIVIAWSIGRSVWSAADGLRAIIACTRFIELINVNVAEMDELQGWFTTDGRSLGSRFGRGECDGVRGHIREWTETEEGVAEQGRSVRADRHASQVLGKNRALEGDSTFTYIRVVGLEMQMSGGFHLKIQV